LTRFKNLVIEQDIACFEMGESNRQTRRALQELGRIVGSRKDRVGREELFMMAENVRPGTQGVLSFSKC
jgi:hypothetical protein